MQRSINDFFTGKSDKTRCQPPKIKMVTILIIRQIKIMTKHVPDINKQSLIIPGEWQGDKNIHNVLNNVLSDNK